MNHEAQITNILYLYAELMDAGNLDGAAQLFQDANIIVRGSDEPINHQKLRESWEDFVQIYPCGTPRTKHLITNPIIEVDEAGETASCRSYYTVLQQTDHLPLQVIAAGRYHDRFRRIHGQWRFIYRDYRLLDHVGDVSHHLKIALTP